MCHPPGLGKTVCALLAAQLPALVVAPASLLVNWRREAELWIPDLADMVDVVSYADRDLFLYSAHSPREYRTLIVDEVHFLKRPDSIRSKLVCRLARRFLGVRGRETTARLGRRRGLPGDAALRSFGCDPPGKNAAQGILERPRGRGSRQPPRPRPWRSVYALSGTPVPNRPIELWPLFWATGVTGLSYDEYAYRFAAAYENEWGKLDVRGASNLPELRRILAPHCLRYPKADVMPWLPEKTYRVVALDLPTGLSEKRYKISDLRRLEEMVAMQVMSTVLREQGERKVALALEHIRSALEEERKVIVFAHHRSVISALVEGLKDYGCCKMHGRMSRRRKQAEVDAFQATGPGTPRVIVGEIQTMGVGWNLTAAKRVIMVEASWVPSDIEQAADRAHRIGQEDHVLVDLLTIHRSLDEHMLRRALEKQEKIEKIVPESSFHLTPSRVNG